MTNGSTGYISIHRKIMETSFYRDPRATCLAIHLLLNATHKDRQIYVGSQEVTLRRGQVLGGFKRLDRELGWKKSSVRRAFYKLKDALFCDHYTTNKYAIITINNYNQYQSEGGYQSTSKGVQNDTGRGTSGTPLGGTECSLECSSVTPYNNDIYNKNNKSDHFESIWSRYPKKIGRKKANGHFNTSVKNQKCWEEINAALTNYLNSNRVTDPKYIMDGKTWFYNWSDWITDPDTVLEDPTFAKIKAGLE